MNLRTKLALALVGMVLTAIAVFSLFAYQLFLTVFVEHVGQQLAVANVERAKRIGELIDDADGVLPNLVQSHDRELTSILDNISRVDASQTVALFVRTAPDLATGTDGWQRIALQDRRLTVTAADAAAIERLTALGQAAHDGYHDTKHRGRAELVSVTPVSARKDIMLVSRVDRDSVLSSMSELPLQLGELGLSLAALGVLGGTLLGVLLARPVLLLADTVRRIHQGETMLRAVVEGEDEVALLAQSLNEFMDGLDHASDIFNLGSLRVLLVAVDLAERRMLSELLGNWRMKVTRASDAPSMADAIEAANGDEAAVQLVIMDGDVLPSTAPVLASLQAQYPLIVLSADDESGYRKIGAQVLPKPVIASDLMNAILKCMGISANPMPMDEDMLLTHKAPSRRILLVEDSELIQTVMRGFLDKWGHEVTLVGNGEEAIKARETQRFDLVFMDVEMPVLDGLAATRRIREWEERTGGEGERVPIVGLTARAGRKAREECMAAGMDEYLMKPVQPRVLYRVIEMFPAITRSEEAGARSSEQRDGVTLAAVTDEDPGPAASAGSAAGSPIDWQVAGALTGGNLDLLSDLVGLFPTESERHLETVADAINARDAESLTRGAHSLKNAAAFFGAPDLVQHALHVENLGRDENLEEAASCMEQLGEEVSRLQRALEQEAAAVLAAAEVGSDGKNDAGKDAKKDGRISPGD